MEGAGCGGWQAAGKEVSGMVGLRLHHPAQKGISAASGLRNAEHEGDINSTGKRNQHVPAVASSSQRGETQSHDS